MMPPTRHTSCRLVALGCLAAAALTGPAHAATTVLTSDNAFVWKADASGDQNDSETLQVKSNGSNSNSRIAYLRFDVSGLTVNAGDAVFLDLNAQSIGSSGPSPLTVGLLVDGTAGETTWDASLTYNTRPDGTGNVPNASVTALAPYGYTSAGDLSVAIDTATFQSALSGDSNNEITLVLYNASGHSGGQTTFSALGNSGANLEPTLRVIQQPNAVAISESVYGGSLQLQAGTYSYAQNTGSAKVGEGGAGNDTQYIQMLMFELPERPSGGFDAGDTSLRLNVDFEDVVTAGEFADLWAIGYVPAEDIGAVGTNLNNGGATDVDDFFLSAANTETKDGWNIGSDDTTKIWDNLASLDSSNGHTLSSPVSANDALTAFINDLYDNHGAAAGDFLVLRVNYDTNMSDFDDWAFFTGSASSGQPVLTLTAVVVPAPAALPTGVLLLGAAAMRRRR